MPNPPHEMLHHIFREDSQLFSRVLAFQEVSFPEPHEIKVGNIDSTETRKVLERRIDTVLEAQTKDGPFLIAIEAQNQPSKLKLRNWAYYPAYLHELKGWPVVVLVVCRDPVTAAWAREPYRIGLPDCNELIERGLEDTPALKDWRSLMALAPLNLQPRSRWAQENIAQGVTASVLQVLDHRGIELTPAVRAHIAACTDLDLARTWLDEALSITDISQLTGLTEG